MECRVRRRYGSVMATACTVAIASFASLNSPATLAQGSFALEEVVVTAQKKAESLQDTPISLTAFGEDRLENEGISSLGDIGSKVPALTIEPFPINNATLRIFIRGIGITDAQVTQDPPVGIYVDGAYVARSTGTALDVAELVRMEILRGPQGTLYGRNTTGGAINLITKKPNIEEREFKQKLTFTNRDGITSKTTFNTPVRDDMAIKLSYLNSRGSGWLKNDGPGGDFGDKKVEGFRFDLRWDVAEWFAFDYAHDKSDLNYYNSTYQPNRPYNDRGSFLDLIRASTTQYVNEGPGYNEDRIKTLSTVAPLEESVTVISGHAATFTFDLNDTTQLKYIAAYRDLDDRAYADLSGGAAVEDDFGEPRGFRLDSNTWTEPDHDGQAGETFGLVVPVVKQRQVSHELQLSGDAFDGAVNYIFGAYYFEEEASEDNEPTHHQFHGVADFQGAELVIANLVSNFYEVENEAAAIFGQFTWTPDWFDQRMHLTFGARHSRDTRYAAKRVDDRAFFYADPAVLLGLGIPTVTQKIEATTDPANCDAQSGAACVALAPIVGAVVTAEPHKVWSSARKKDFKDDSFAFTIEFDVTDDINTYFKVVEAYKSGGFNTRDPHQNASDGGNDYGFGFEEGFNEEKVLSYELGIKSELLDRRLRINADYFYSEYSDIQLNFLVDGTVADTKVANAGEGVMHGFEADVTFLALENLMLIFNFAYLNTEIVEATNPIDGSDASDEFQYNSAPEFSYTGLADWTVYYADWGRTFLNVSVNYMDERKGGVLTEGTSRLKLSDYYLWNARLGIADIPLWGGSLNTGIFGKNIFDAEGYELTTVDNLPIADRATIYGDPPTYGVDFIWSWGG